MDYKAFLQKFNEKCGYDFSDYSSNSISRRLQKICDETGMTFEQILKQVVADRNFVRRIVEDITVNTTELFRDPAIWISLSNTLYKQLPKRTSMCTFWHIGCSSGLEAYSNIIMLNELGLGSRSRVIGTDINPTMLDVARRGEYVYSFNRAYIDNFNAVMRGLGLSTKFDKYFEIDTEADLIKVRPEIKALARFLQQDLVKDQAPFAYKVDVAFIRNVMIYFNDDLQKRIVEAIVERMHPGAMLVMGKQETLPQSVEALFTLQGSFYKKKR